jgi:hypothetical protein
MNIGARDQTLSGLQCRGKCCKVRHTACPSMRRVIDKNLERYRRMCYARMSPSKRRVCRVYTWPKTSCRCPAALSLAPLCRNHTSISPPILVAVKAVRRTVEVSNPLRAERLQPRCTPCRRAFPRWTALKLRRPCDGDDCHISPQP